MGATALRPRSCHAQGAQHADAARAYGSLALSEYERQTIREALTQRGAEVDPAPEGKVIERVELVRLPVFEPRDPMFTFVNVFHSLSQPFTIERELLFAQGDRWSPELVAETARNLRQLPQLSVVLVVPVRSGPGRVRALVITKDVWSLRLSSDYRVTSQGLEYLFLAPTETNFLGTHQALGVQFTYLPETIGAGLRYTIPRIGKSWLRLTADANVIWNLASGAVEGSVGQLSYGQPFYRIAEAWSYGATLSWRQEITRRYVGSQVATFDAEATPDVSEAIPFRYRTDVVTGQLFGGHSLFLRHKLNFIWGLEVLRRVYRVDGLEAFAPEAADEFRRRFVPVSDQRISPFVEARAFETAFTRIVDHETLTLQEDLRLGHDVYARVYGGAQALLSSRNVLGLAAGAQYTLALGDGFARALVDTVHEWAFDERGGKLADGAVTANVRLTTPRTPAGRLVFDSTLLHRHANYLNRLSALGGDTRLRGFSSQRFLGKDVFAANLEFRSRPLEVLSVALAGAAFVDVGGAANGLESLQLQQSAGLGLRLLLPQVNRVVIRADWGFPLTKGHVENDDLPGEIVVTFEQAFPLASVR